MKRYWDIETKNVMNRRYKEIGQELKDKVEGLFPGIKALKPLIKAMNPEVSIEGFSAAGNYDAKLVKVIKNDVTPILINARQIHLADCLSEVDKELKFLETLEQPSHLCWRMLPTVGLFEEFASAETYISVKMRFTLVYSQENV